MLKRPSKLIEGSRVLRGPFATTPGDLNGCFHLKRRGVKLVVISSNGGGWEHVSISTRLRVPHWEEMCWIKDQFWDPEETVMQLHPPKSTWINNAPTCLHLWRPVEAEIPLPPSLMVGVPGGPMDREAKELLKRALAAGESFFYE